MEIKSTNETKSIGVSPDDKRLISFRIAHEPSEQVSSPKSPRPTSPYKKTSKNFVVTNENAKWCGNSRPLDPRSKPFEVSKPVVVIAVRDEGTEEEKHGETTARPQDIQIHRVEEEQSVFPTVRTPRNTIIEEDNNSEINKNKQEPTPSTPPNKSNKKTPSTPSPAISSNNRRIEIVEKALATERETSRQLRREVDSLYRQLAEARREAEAARREAAHEKACASEAHEGLEQEAELVWDEAEAWVEHEEALEMRAEQEDLYTHHHKNHRLDDTEFEEEDDDDLSSNIQHVYLNQNYKNEKKQNNIIDAIGSEKHLQAEKTKIMRETHPPSEEPLQIGTTSNQQTQNSAAASPISIEFSDEDDDAWAVALFKGKDKQKNLHLKFSSPQRRPPSPAEAKRRHDERHLGAERNQRRLRDEHARKFATRAAHAQHVRARGEEARSDKEAKTADRHAKAGARHAAYLASVRRKAVRDTAKVQEVGWTNALTSQEVRADLRRRLDEVEARIDLARTRRLDRLKTVQTKLNKRDREKQEQLSAQSLKRAEMASSRWEQLQARLAAVEARRAARLERLKHLAVKQQEPKKKIEVRPASTRRRRRVDEHATDEPQPKSASLSPKNQIKSNTIAKRRNSTGQHPNIEAEIVNKSVSDDEATSPLRNKAIRKADETFDDKPKTNRKSKHDHRRKRTQRNKKKQRALSIDEASSSSSSLPDQANKVPSCDDATVQAALAVETALVKGSNTTSKIVSSSSNRMIATEALLRTADAIRGKRWKAPPVDAWSALVQALEWTLRQWRAQHDYQVEDDKIPFSAAKVAIAALEACVVGLQSSAPALAAHFAADTALVSVLRDVIAAAGRDEPLLAAATLRVVAETAAAGTVAKPEDRPHIKRLLFSPEPQHEADPDLARIHCVIGAVVAALVMGSVGDTVPMQIDQMNGAPISPLKKSIQHSVASPPLTSRQTSLLDKWRLSVAGVDALNAVARFDRTALNDTVFAAGSHRPQLLHVLDRLFVDALESSDDPSSPEQQDAGLQDNWREQAALTRAKEACLDALVELVGHFALDNQECLQWGMASRITLLHRLVHLPFKYFSRPQHKDVLFPTLIACCFENDRNTAVAAEEMSVRVLADYVRIHLDVLNQASQKAKNSSNTSLKKPPQFGLRGRFPEHLWPRALAYFDRLCDAETLDWYIAERSFVFYVINFLSEFFIMS